MKILIQYYDDHRDFRIFSMKKPEGEAFVDIKPHNCGSRTEAKRILKKMGFKFNKTEKTDWGFEVTITSD